MPKKVKSTRPRRKIIVPKECYFCVEKKEPVFSDIDPLKKFLTDRGKIVGRDRNGICSKHQRHLTIAIKHSRHIGLLPFVA